MDNLDQILIVLFTTISLAVCVATTYWLNKRIHKKHEEIQNKGYSFYSIIPEIGLFELPLFWIPISLTGTFSICLSVAISTDYNIKISQDGFDLFLDIVQLPALIMAICIPISAAIARAHSTKQTAEVINREYKKFNRVEQREHKKDYYNFFESTSLAIKHPYEPNSSVKANPSVASYSYFYTTKENSLPTINKKKVFHITKKLEKAAKIASKLKNPKSDERNSLLKSLHIIYSTLQEIAGIISSYEIDSIQQRYTTYTYQEKDLFIAKFQKIKLYDIYYCLYSANSYLGILRLFDENLEKNTKFHEKLFEIERYISSIIMLPDLEDAEKEFKIDIESEIKNRITNSKKTFNEIMQISEPKKE